MRHKKYLEIVIIYLHKMRGEMFALCHDHYYFSSILPRYFLICYCDKKTFID